jgi:hypothetical protein
MSGSQWFTFVTKGINWEEAVQKRASSCNKILRLLASKGMHLNGFRFSTSRFIYKAFIRPILEYGFAIEILPKDTMNKLQQIQNEACRRMFSSANTTSIAAMHRLLNIAPLSFRNEILHAKFRAKLLKLSKDEIVQKTVVLSMCNFQKRCLGTQQSSFQKAWTHPFWDKQWSLLSDEEK